MKLGNIFWRLVFWIQLIIYGYFAIQFMYSWCYPTLGPTYSGCNLIYATWKGLHATSLLQLLICGITIRLILPKTWEGFLYSTLGLIFAPLIGETYFVPIYGLITGDWFNAGNLWNLPRLSVFLLWYAIFMSGAWKMFNLKIIVIGLGLIAIQGWYWITFQHFILWRSPATGDLYINAFMGHWMTIVYYTIFCTFYILAFNGKIPKPVGFK
jgi:hypothetical protein